MTDAQADLDHLRQYIKRAANEARNVQPPSEQWNDDQVYAVERFAEDLMEMMGWGEPPPTASGCVMDSDRRSDG